MSALVAERGWAGGTILSHLGSNTYWVAEVWILAEQAIQRTVEALNRNAFAPR